VLWIPEVEGGSMKRAYVFAAVAAFAVAHAGQAAAEFCGDAAPDSGFGVARVWPVDCSTSTPRDALLYVSGADGEPSVPAGSTLSVRVAKSEKSEPCEATLPGTIEFVQGGNVALWRGLAPFAPHTEYTLTAQRFDTNGAPSGGAATSTFVTGDGFMQPITLRGDLDVTSRTLLTAQRSCSFDSCGESDCHDGEGQVERNRVSIYVPPLDGGLPAAQGDTFDTSYEVVAVFEEAPAEGRGQHVFASKKVTIERLTHAMVELDIPVFDQAFDGCAQVTVSDLSGASLELPPQCITITPQGEDEEAAPEFERSLDAASAGDEQLDAPQRVQASAGGCSATSGRANLPLMLAALLLLLARRRLPF
jgi:hypothetical protein